MIGELQPSEGTISRHSHLKIAYYNQHSEDQLDLEKTPLDYIMEIYKDGVIPPFQTTGEKKILRWKNGEVFWVHTVSMVADKP